jgi:phosphoribosylglycinamide formyltransferase
VSGGGSNFKAIHMAMQAGRIPHAEAVAVVSDVPSCGGIQYAVDQGIETLTYPIPKKGGFPGLTPDDLVTRLQELSVDYVILAGYLKLIPSTLVAAFPNRMLNIHPGLLPSFGGKGMYGENVHKAVVASGARRVSIDESSLSSRALVTLAFLSLSLSLSLSLFT